MSLRSGSTKGKNKRRNLAQQDFEPITSSPPVSIGRRIGLARASQYPLDAENNPDLATIKDNISRINFYKSLLSQVNDPRQVYLDRRDEIDQDVRDFDRNLNKAIQTRETSLSKSPDETLSNEVRILKEIRRSLLDDVVLLRATETVDSGDTVDEFKDADESDYEFPSFLPSKTVVDESGNVVPFVPLTPQQIVDLEKRMRTLQRVSPLHYNILRYMEGEVLRAFGEIGLHELYKGGHIIFEDNKNIYNTLFQMARPLAANASSNPQTPLRIMDKSTAVGSIKGSLVGYSQMIGRSLTSSQLAQGKMFMRRPAQSETSHYKSKDEMANADPNRPQLGIDLPSSVKGHVLFGIVPRTSSTFVQTEGAGFQDTNQHVLQHTLGYFKNAAVSLQTGLIGSSTHSEKTSSGSTALKEQPQSQSEPAPTQAQPSSQSSDLAQAQPSDQVQPQSQDDSEPEKIVTEFDGLELD